MSVIVSTSEQICNSPTNNSKSKMRYSFGKSCRFETKKKDQCKKFYEINTKNNSRSTMLGYGVKYDFTKELPLTPGPGNYETETLFNLAKRKNKGFGFGCGRHQMEITGPININKNPGPGSYESKSSKSLIYSSIKGKGIIQDKQNINKPGPGTYQSFYSFNKNKSIFFSKFKNKSACKFAQQQKMKQQDKKTPGPSVYDVSKTYLNSQGKYFYARLESAKGIKFTKSIRVTTQNRCKTPGPGNYRVSSQFGYYRSKYAMADEDANNKTVSYDI